MKRERTEQRSKAVWGGRVSLALAIATTMVLPSCSKAIRQGTGSSYLVINSLTGGKDNDATVESDVISDEGGVLQDSGQVKILTADDVFEQMKAHPDPKVQRDAANVREIMKKNGEILVQGEIPQSMIRKCK